MGKPEDYTKKVNRLKEARQLGLTKNNKYRRDQFLAVLKDKKDAFNYKYPSLREEIENSLKEFFSKSKAISHNTGVDGAIEDLVKWLEDENTMDRDISWDPDTSKFLLDLVYKKIDENYLLSRPGHKKVEDELKKLGVNHGEKYSKDQMAKILKNKEQYPILYEQIENYVKNCVEKNCGYFIKNDAIFFQKFVDKIFEHYKQYSKDQMIKILNNKEQYPLLYEQLENYVKNCVERSCDYFIKNDAIFFQKFVDKIFEHLENNTTPPGRMGEIVMDVIRKFVDNKV